MPPESVLVVGAGPVGLVMAAELKRHGVPCQIIDQAPHPTDKSKALAIWSRTLEVFAAMGIVEPFLAAGVKNYQARIFAQGRQILDLDLGKIPSPYPCVLMLPQSQTEQILAQAGGVQVVRGVQLLGFTQDSQGVEVELRYPDQRQETYSCGWLVGCDGAHSTVRHCLGIDFPGSTFPADWYLADVAIEGRLPAGQLAFWGSTGVLAILAVRPGQFRLIANLDYLGPHTKPAPPTLEQMQAIVDQRGPTGLTLRDPTWLSSFRISERKVSTYSQGRVFLAGDAAHVHSPVGGQGMNTGIQDAYNLAWKLALVVKGQARADLLESYTQERSPVGDQVLRSARFLTYLATVRTPPLQSLRNHLVSLGSRQELIQRQIRARLSQVGVNYHHSSIVQGSGGGLRPGDRVPDVTLLDPGTNASCQLFDLFSHPQHHLLLLGQVQSWSNLHQLGQQIHRAYDSQIRPIFLLPGTPAKIPEFEFPVWLDPQQVVYRRCRVRQSALYLIRPDGYVGFSQQPATGGALQDYLDKIFA